ncbi:hypothetical protein [Treponema sp.]|uniref:hypothetical protein n=1 Tax=Treponema sp. TaxID=166 RepID=UPI003890E73F
MKLNKVFKKTVLTSMSVLIAATLSFTGCSNGSSDSDDYEYVNDPITFSERKEYSGTADIATQKERIAFVLQIDNPSKSAKGLKMTVSNLKIKVTIGNNAEEYNLGTMELLPDQYAVDDNGTTVPYLKSAARKLIGLSNGELASTTKIKVQVMSATVNDKSKASSIIFGLLENDGDYRSVSGTLWQPAFAEATPATTAAWVGNTTFEEWNKSSGEDINIGKDKITTNTIGLRITWSAEVDSGVVLKMQAMNWGESNRDVKFKKNGDTDYSDNCYLWKTSTTTDFTIAEDSLSKIKEYGVQVYGDKITITKVEIIESN